MRFRDISRALTEVSARHHVYNPPAFLVAARDYLVWLLRTLNDLLRGLFRHSGGSLDSSAVGSALQLVIFSLALVALGACLFYLIKRLRARGLQQKSQIKGASFTQQIVNASDWKQQAEKLAQEEDYRGACRAVYLCLLKDLDENGIAPFAPTKTNFEYAYMLKKYPQIEHQFNQLASIVEAIWFGNKTAASEDFAQSSQHLLGLEAGIKEARCQKEAAAASRLP